MRANYFANYFSVTAAESIHQKENAARWSGVHIQ